MKKLRLDVDRLVVESFTAAQEEGGRGTVRAHDPTDCSCVLTCGNQSAGPEGYERAPRTLYACCV